MHGTVALKTRELAPGSLLQRLFVRERIRGHRLTGRRFLEFGSGNGYNPRLLLDEGLRGVGVDLNETACAKNELINREYIDANKYKVQCADFWSAGADRALR
jgi:hypothetical protein